MSNLELLTDLPAGVDEPDEFEHKIYAEMLADIFNSNPPAISVGLFGKWGQGKSTVVNLLKAEVHENQQIVVFNAWKARGDAVRRQLLLTVLRKIKSPRYEEISRFFCPGIPLRLRQYEEQKPYRESHLWWLLARTEKLDFWVISAITVALVAAVALVNFFVKALGSPEPHALLLWCVASLVTLISSCMTVVFRWFRNRKELLLTSAEPVSDSQRLKYPEQFQKVFNEELSSFCENGNKLLVVIDDLDRCDPNTVVEALSAIRQFSDPSVSANKSFHCQFLVPCDEQQIVFALEADGHYAGTDGARYHDYQSEELLRKFFDVVLRMDHFLWDDLLQYTKALAEKIDIDVQSARELVDIVKARDPRQIKKLLNAYKLERNSLQRRQEAKLLPRDKKDLPRLKWTMLTLVALRETVPPVYEAVCNKPELLQEPSQIQELEGLEELSKKKALGILERAGKPSVLTAWYLTTGRYEKELRGVECGGQFSMAYKEDDLEVFNNLVIKAEKNVKDQLKEWMLNRIGEIITVSELRGKLSLFLKHAELGQPRVKYIASCVEKCISKQHYITETLKDFKELRLLADMMEFLSKKYRQITDRIILRNFKAKQDKEGIDELLFLLCTLDYMDEKTLADFTSWFESYMKSDHSGNAYTLIKELMARLSTFREKCYGKLPSVGIIMSKHSAWRDDAEENENEESWTHYQLIKCFVGDNSDEARDCIDNILGQEGVLETPIALSQAGMGVIPAWHTVRDLMSVIDPDEGSALFPQLSQWLRTQQAPNDSRIILDAIKPMLFYLNEHQLDEIGTIVSKLMWTHPEELWIVAYVGRRPRKKYTKNWQHLCKAVFKAFADHLGKDSALQTSRPAQIESIVRYKWPVATLADSLLAEKLRQLPNGNIRNIDEWVDSLAPLLNGTVEGCQKVINGFLYTHDYLAVALKAGRRILWMKLIPAEDARTIGNQCFESANLVTQYENELEALIGINGSKIVFETIVDLLNDDRNWLYGNAKLLEVVAKASPLLDAEHKHVFLTKVKKLILSDQPQVATAGVQILTFCDSLNPDIVKTIRQTASVTTDDSLANACKHLLEKHSVGSKNSKIK